MIEIGYANSGRLEPENQPEIHVKRTVFVIHREFSHSHSLDRSRLWTILFLAFGASLLMQRILRRLSRLYWLAAIQDDALLEEVRLSALLLQSYGAAGATGRRPFARVPATSHARNVGLPP